jgi:hypothetical protein
VRLKPSLDIFPLEAQRAMREAEASKLAPIRPRYDRLIGQP